MSANRTKKSSKIRSTGDVSGKSPGPKAQAARCGFCNLGYEVERTCDTLYVADGVAAHFLCMLYSSGLIQEDSDSSQFEDFGMFNPEDVKKEIKRGLQLSCSVCHKKGATIGCDRKMCTKTCHYKCGMDYDYVFEENPDEGQFLMYCPKHKDLTTDADDDDENWRSSDEEERDEEQDDENTDPSWDASPSKRSTPKRKSERKKGRPAKKRGQRNDDSSPRRSKRSRTTVKYQETDEESFSDEDMLIPVGRRMSPKKEKKIKEKAQDDEDEDADKETSEQEDEADDEEDGSGDKRMDRKHVRTMKEKDQDEEDEDTPDDDEDDESGDEKMEKKDDKTQKTGASDFWDQSRKAGTLGTVCTRVKQAMQSALKKIQDNTASEIERAAVLSFMETTRLMEQIEEEQKKDSGKKRNGQTRAEQPEDSEDEQDVPPKKAARFHSPRKGVKK
ncbi:transcriptional regulator ATRX homolog [Branchiostoma floridae]|uniref:Transcriptional regulator ATRX homolog n=1 Tax=Branchiostoma floridae TaxID=7739 RepID=C3ZZY1_BRAFL|nr:transcriptional regulator ATRX homolog [Branchiostoma floridae]|eukprot:XP_002585891.1 hypothetical protein BRAFLDRAFT_132880 [Branchiostoma floridae]